MLVKNKLRQSSWKTGRHWKDCNEGASQWGSWEQWPLIQWSRRRLLFWDRAYPSLAGSTVPIYNSDKIKLEQIYFIKQNKQQTKSLYLESNILHFQEPLNLYVTL